jgi:hypothetical protein
MTTPTFDNDKPLVDEQPMKSPYSDYVWEWDKVQVAITLISESFDWTRSPQGHDYWYETVRNLREIMQYGRHVDAENALPCL